jgi:hypothetical protein
LKVCFVAQFTRGESNGPLHLIRPDCIAAALVALVLQQAFSTAKAQIGNCGATSHEPCAVYLVFLDSGGHWQNCLDEGKDRCK